MSRLFSIPVVVVVTVFGFADMLSAADQPAPAGPAVEHSVATACDTCGKVRSLHFPHSMIRTPHQPKLAPGSCFGYFQTQWNRWENVCPIPYQGMPGAPVHSAPGGIRPTLDPKAGGSDGPIPLRKVPPVPAK